MVNLRIEGRGGSGVKAVQDLAKALGDVEKKAEDSGKKLTKAEKDAERLAKQADPTRRYTSEINRLANAVTKGGLEIDKAETLAKRYGDRLERAGRLGQGAFGSRAIGDLKSFALQYTSVNALISAGNALLRKQQQIREEAAGKATAARGGIGALAQLAATADDPQAEFARLVGEARGIRASGGADSFEEAAQTLFSLVSAGLNQQDRNFGFRLRGSGIIGDVGGAASSFAALQTALGRGEVGSFRDVISKSLAASAIAPAQANELVQAAAQSGGSAAALGLTDESLLAAVAILAKTRGSASEGGTQLAAFLKQVEKGGLGGGSLIDIVQSISALPAGEKGIGGVLGDRAEAVQGFRVLEQNIQTLIELRRSVEQSQAGNLAGVAIGLPGGDSSQAAAIARARGEGSLDVALVGRGSQENIIRAAQADHLASLREQGNEVGAIVSEMIFGVNNFLGTPNVDDVANIANGGFSRHVNSETREAAQAVIDIRNNQRAKTVTRPE